MKTRTILLLCGILGIFLPALGNTRESDLTPDIIFPKPGTDCILGEISDNGRWAVYGSSIVDVSAEPFVYREIGGSARDVADDGKTAVGSYGGSPAVWRDGEGWTRLPLPEGTRGGSATAVTPDGRYAVGTVGLGVVNSSDGCMWDLQALSLVELPGRPTEDRAAKTDDPNPYQNQYDAVSADGRYVLGTLGYSYVGWQVAYVYDRLTSKANYIGYKKDADGWLVPDDPMIHYTECEGMSPDGHYVTGPVYILKGEQYISAYRYDVWNDTFEYYDAGIQADAWGFTVSNDGLVFLRKTAYSPYSEGYVCLDGFFYSFHDILTVGYGIDLGKYGIDNTGVPARASADGRELFFINSPQSGYFVRFKEDLRGICERLDLLREWTCTPRPGSVMSKVSALAVGFSYPVSVSADDYRSVELLDARGAVLAHPVAGGGLYAEGNILKINFRPRDLEPGEKYCVRIPAALCHVEGLPDRTNGEILIEYEGRREGPVAPVRIFPEDGASVSAIDLQENPILLTFDAEIKAAASPGETARIYIDDSPDPVAPLYAALYDDTTLALFPPGKVNLYAGSSYTVEIPAGLVTDLSGSGASDALTLSYYGSFTPHLGDEKYIFRSTCDNWDNFLFYEGDHGTPTAEYAAMGFTADTTPWWVVMDNAASTDMAFGSHSCYTDGRQADDWVVTRQIYIPDESVVLEFDGQSYRRSREDILTVIAYPCETMMNALTPQTVDRMRTEGEVIFRERLQPGATEGGIDGEWTHYAVSLAGYAGKNVYIAFVNDNRNQSLVMIDNVEVSRKVDAFLTISSPTDVVDKESIEISGFLSIENQFADYTSLRMELLDGEGTALSEISEEGLSLKGGDSFRFTFPDPLPLTAGEEASYTIRYRLDDWTDTYSSAVRNLAFEPAKRVVLEEFTGRDCQFCPQGHAMIRRLEEMFPSRFIPVGLYCFNGSDPKGSAVMDYWSYLGMTAAPSARVNRRPATMPMAYSSLAGQYVYTSAQLPGDAEPLWFDEVADELARPSFIDVEVEGGQTVGTLGFTARIRSALNVDNHNLRVFGVLVENGLIDYQTNGMYETEDPLLGEWGKGGTFGSGLVYSKFDHAAKATWGVSYSGSANLLPASLQVGETYEVDMRMDMPSSVTDIANCDFVVMVIDGNSGRILNAATTAETSGLSLPSVEGAASEATVMKVAEGLSVTSAGPAEVSVYTPAGVLIGCSSGSGSFTVPLHGYSGILIVRVRTAGGVSSRKIL